MLFHDRALSKTTCLFSKAKEDIDIQQNACSLIHSFTKNKRVKTLSFAFIFDLPVANIKCCHVVCCFFFSYVDCLVKEKKKKNATNRSRRNKKADSSASIYCVASLFVVDNRRKIKCQ